MLLSRPPFFPFVWAESGIFLAGERVEEAAAAGAIEAKVTVSERLAWCARRRRIAHRLPLLSSEEVDLLGPAALTLASLWRRFPSGEMRRWEGVVERRAEGGEIVVSVEWPEFQEWRESRGLGRTSAPLAIAVGLAVGGKKGVTEDKKKKVVQAC